MAETIKVGYRGHVVVFENRGHAFSWYLQSDDRVGGQRPSDGMTFGQYQGVVFDDPFSPLNLHLGGKR